MPYELRNDGNTVMVPKDRVARLRMSLAGEGLPKGGGVGYEIFDKSDALGTTSFIQNINNLRALEGELARTIRGLDRVAGGARASGAAGAAAVLARQGGAVRVDRAQGPRHAGAAAGARHPPSGRRPPSTGSSRSGCRSSTKRGRLLADGTGDDRMAAKSASTSGGRRSRSGCATRSRRSSRPWSARAARASRSAPISISTGSPRRRTNSIRRAASCVRARRARRRRRPTSRDNQVTVGNEIPGGGNQRQQQGAGSRGQCRGRATRAENPRKSSITRFRRRPRPK